MRPIYLYTLCVPIRQSVHSTTHYNYTTDQFPLCKHSLHRWHCSSCIMQNKPKNLALMSRIVLTAHEQDHSPALHIIIAVQNCSPIDTPILTQTLLKARKAFSVPSTFHHPTYSYIPVAAYLYDYFLPSGVWPPPLDKTPRAAVYSKSASKRKPRTDTVALIVGGEA